MAYSSIFVGSIYPPEMLDSIIRENSHVDFAANTFQMGIVEGLTRFYDDFHIITSPVTSKYPISRKLCYGHKKLSLEFSGKSINVVFPGFINLPLIKLVTEFLRIKRNLKNLLKDGDTVYVYALHSPFLLAVYTLRKHISKVCVIIPDLPDYMSHNNGVFRRFMKRINKLIINKCLRSFQYDVLFSRYMEPELPLSGKKWITVEGMYQASILPKYKKKERKIILYSGIISSKYGVFDLIEAFGLINSDDFVLWLCGSCSEAEKIKLNSIKDSRIKYFGMLQKEEVRLLQVRATLLVNPRHSSEEFTKYSFPSKTMEYLASGTSTLMCKLPAIPEEYYEHLYFFDDESIEGYARKIVEICSMDPEMLRVRGEKAREFILKEKNCYSQAKRIFDMIEKVE